MLPSPPRGVICNNYQSPDALSLSLFLLPQLDLGVSPFKESHMIHNFPRDTHALASKFLLLLYDCPYGGVQDHEVDGLARQREGLGISVSSEVSSAINQVPAFWVSFGYPVGSRTACCLEGLGMMSGIRILEKGQPNPTEGLSAPSLALLAQKPAPLTAIKPKTSNRGRQAHGIVQEPSIQI